ERDLDFKPLESLDEIVAHRTALLTAYQSASYAGRYRRLVETVAAAEARVMPGRQDLAVAVARSFAKLMAYKDEYEVARLLGDPKFEQQIEDVFGKGVRIRYNLAPPLLARPDRQSGLPRKREFGSWMRPVLGALARMKFLRGTPLDPFGHTAERKLERALIDEYEARMTRVAGELTAMNYRVAIERAELPSRSRGFGHVKSANVAKVKALEAELLARFSGARSDDAAREASTYESARRGVGCQASARSPVMV